MGTEPTCDCFGDGFQASTFGRAHDGVERCDFCGRPVKNPTVTVYANDLDDLQTALAAERAEVERLKHDIARHVAICAEQANELVAERDARERAEQERDALQRRLDGCEAVAGNYAKTIDRLTAPLTDEDVERVASAIAAVREKHWVRTDGKGRWFVSWMDGEIWRDHECQSKEACEAHINQLCARAAIEALRGNFN